MVLYDTIEQAIRQHKNKVIVEQATPHEVRNAIRWVMRNNPEFFGLHINVILTRKQELFNFNTPLKKERVASIKQSIDDVIQNDFCSDYVKNA